MPARDEDAFSRPPVHDNIEIPAWDRAIDAERTERARRGRVKWIAAAVALALAVGAWWFRWESFALERQSGGPSVFTRDRWTGQPYVVYPDGTLHPVERAKP